MFRIHKSRTSHYHPAFKCIVSVCVWGGVGWVVFCLIKICTLRIYGLQMVLSPHLATLDTKHKHLAEHLVRPLICGNPRVIGSLDEVATRNNPRQIGTTWRNPAELDTTQHTLAQPDTTPHNPAQLGTTQHIPVELGTTWHKPMWANTALD